MENLREGIWARSQKHLYWRCLSWMAVRSAYVERMWGALNEEDVVTKIQWSVLPSGSISRFTRSNCHSARYTQKRARRHGSGWLGKGLRRRQAFLGCQRLLPLQLPFDDAERLRPVWALGRLGAWGFVRFPGKIFQAR